MNNILSCNGSKCDLAHRDQLVAEAITPIKSASSCTVRLELVQHGLWGGQHSHFRRGRQQWGSADANGISKNLGQKFKPIDKKVEKKVESAVAKEIVKEEKKEIKQAVKHARQSNQTRGPRSKLGKFVHAGGSLLDSAFGGGKAIANIGGNIGDWFSNIMGWGDYEVNSNSVMSSVIKGTDPPVMHSTDDGCIVRHREYICDIMADAEFQTIIIPINPGVLATFPWLSGLANNFQQYKWLGLVAEYKPLISNYAANGQLGYAIMASQYNVNAPVFNNKQQIDNHHFTTSARLDQAFVHPVECNPRQVPYNLYSVRSTPPQDKEDLRLSDMLYMTIATGGHNVAEGQSAKVGELWMTYDIMLCKPKLSSNMGFALPTASFGKVFTRMGTWQMEDYAFYKDQIHDYIGVNLSVVGQNLRFTLPPNLAGLYVLTGVISGGGFGGQFEFAGTNVTKDSSYIYDGIQQIISNNGNALTFQVGFQCNGSSYATTSPYEQNISLVNLFSLPDFQVNTLYAYFLITQVNGSALDKPVNLLSVLNHAMPCKRPGTSTLAILKAEEPDDVVTLRPGIELAERKEEVTKVISVKKK